MENSNGAFFKNLTEAFEPGKDMKRRVWPVALALTYLALITVFGQITALHVAIISLVLLDSYNEKTRHFLLHFLPFILVAVIYDSMRFFYWPVLAHLKIHIAEPYLLEKSLFGINDAGVVLTPNEFFQKYHWSVLDFFCGLAYLTFVAEYLFAGFALYFKKHYDLLKKFGWCFFLVNMMGFATYYIYAAAPPWYVEKYGLGPARLDIGPSSASAVRFDELLGTHFFSSMYGKGVDVYGAIPSLHVSYPFLVMWAAFMAKRFRVPAAMFYCLMCFSAVYLNHHYIIDITLGTVYALVALVVVQWFFGEKREGSVS